MQKIHVNASVRAFSNVIESNHGMYSVGSAECCQTAAMVDFILKNVVQLIGQEECNKDNKDKEKEEQEEDHWVSHCRWYDLCGVQHVLGFLQTNRSVSSALRERPGCEHLERFVALSELAVEAVLKVLNAQ
jgi:hypothetical protein